MNDSDAMESMSRTFSSILTTHRQIQRAKDELESVNDYFGDDYSPTFIEKAVHSRIDLLHRYNEIKDLGSFLIGKVAEVEGKTVKEMYEELGLDLED
ncbi:hypothetical protein BKA69DRAFT_1100235 [Paraphysoderma sedebokerense]|nr:hypothetical protein BKA69DRAFT_1100235 [Paraphysoderma sedebokerense]